MGERIVNGQERLTKEPWLAVNLSWLVPGIGQFYAGVWLAGVVLLGAWLGLQVLVAWQLVSVEGRLLIAAVLVLGSLAVWLFGFLHAYYRARKANTLESELARKQVKDPFLAVFLTQILPGLGHLYLRKRVVGGLLLILTVLLLVIVPFVPLLFVLPVYEPVVSLLAYRAAPSERRRNRAGLLGLCLLMFGAGLLGPSAALLCRAHVVEAFHVPTGAMMPTIMPGDRILAWKRPFEPQRGDVVVFINPRKRNQNYVKRVAAVAGETIEVKRDGIYVAGTRLSEGVLGQHTNVEPLRPPEGGTICAEEGDPVTVPPRHVFVLGDYINRSFDSRFFGPIPVEDIVGKAYKRYWPLGRAGPIE